MTELLQAAIRLQQDLTGIRRDLHRHPELSFCETRTAGVAADAVAQLGWRVQRGVGRTGVVAELGKDAPIVALRADMDALPIQEANAVDYRSSVAGVMHACGHDAHVAMLIGAAGLISEADAAGRLRGTVRLLFQPSEEGSDDDGLSGASRMIEDGAMAGVRAIFGLHIGAHLPFGRAFVSPGPIMAGSDRFVATVRGRSSHAGRPHEGVDAIVLAAHVVIACQLGLSRRIAPADEAALAIGMINGGTAENVLADSVTLRGTIRYFQDHVRNVLRDSLERGLRAADALGGTHLLELMEGYPPVDNDAAATDIALAALTDTLGADSVVKMERMMAAEDFSLLGREAPGCFFWLGAALDPPREHHHPAFDIDERALPIGAAALAACALVAPHRLDS